jgi:hypothetical protein
MELTFRPYTTSDGQVRLAVLINNQVVVRAPSLRETTVRHTTPGSAVWVLSENSKALRRLERQLRDGARVLRPVSEAKLKRSVLSGASYLTAADLAGLTEERAGAAQAILARQVDRAAAKKKKAAKKAAKKPTAAAMSAANLAALSQTIEALRAELAEVKAAKASEG